MHVGDAYLLSVRTGLSDGLGGVGVNDAGLVRLSVQELVVENLDLRVVAAEQRDLVGDGLSIGESRYILSNTRKRQLHVLSIAPAQLRLALLTHNNEVGLRRSRENSSCRSRHTRVDTATQSLVGRANDEERLLAISFDGLGLGLLEGLV